MPGGPFSGSFARGIDHRPVLDEVGQPAFRAASEGARQFTVHPADLLQGRCPVEPDSALKITQLFHSGLGFAPLGKAKSFLAHCPESHRPGCRPVFPVLDERVVFVCGIPQVLPPAFLRSEAFTSMPQPHAVFEVVHSSQEPGIPSALGRGKRPKALAPSGQVALDLITSVEPLACRACHTGHYRAYRGRSRAAARVLGGPRPRAGRRARAERGPPVLARTLYTHQRFIGFRECPGYDLVPSLVDVIEDIPAASGKRLGRSRSSGRGLLGGFSVVCLVFAVVRLPVACFGTLAFSLL